nr:ribonuclease H-like domain-containing protein [Tanacetum cinerariifolium]
MFKDPNFCKIVVDQFLTPREMVRIKALTDERLAGKMSVLHWLMMSHEGELLARYRGLLKSHDEYIQSTYSRLKSFQQRFTSFQGLESKVLGLKKQVTDHNDKFIAFDATFVKAKAKGKEQKKKIKSLSKSLDQFTTEAARLAFDLNQARSTGLGDLSRSLHMTATKQSREPTGTMDNIMVCVRLGVTRVKIAIFLSPGKVFSNSVERTDDELTEKELKQIEADDQAIQTILLGLPKDIYAAVDTCETAQEIWLRVQQMMKGSDIGIQEKKAKVSEAVAGLVLPLCSLTQLSLVFQPKDSCQDLPEWTGSEVQEEIHHDEDLAAANPYTKVLAKAEASKKRRASTSGAAPSQVAKRTRSTMAHSSESSTRPNLFDDNDSGGEESDDDDDACVEIPLITPIRFAATIPIGGNQSGGYVPSLLNVLAPMILKKRDFFPFALVTLVGEHMSLWKGSLPRLPIKSNIVRLATP